MKKQRKTYKLGFEEAKCLQIDFDEFFLYQTKCKVPDKWRGYSQYLVIHFTGIAAYMNQYEFYHLLSRSSV